MRLLFVAIVAAALFGCASAKTQAPAEIINMSAYEFREQNLNSKSVVVDVRTSEEFATGHLEGAVNSDFRGGAFAKEFENWDKDKTYYLYCASGNRSSQAAALMKEANFRNIVNLGAYKDLKEAGMPTETGSQQ